MSPTPIGSRRAHSCRSRLLLRSRLASAPSSTPLSPRRCRFSRSSLVTLLRTRGRRYGRCPGGISPLSVWTPSGSATPLCRCQPHGIPSTRSSASYFAHGTRFSLRNSRGGYADGTGGRSYWRGS